MIGEVGILDQDQEEAAALAAAARIAAMDGFGNSLMELKDAAVRYRQEHERQWSEDLRQFNGESFDELPRTKQTANNEDDYRRTRDNITRSKVLITEARLGDMLFPTNDSNWDMESEADPELPPGLVPESDGDGQPLTPEAIKMAASDVARQRALAMRKTIRGQLNECDYATAGRYAIAQAVLYGTGVLRGPILKTSVRRKYSVGAGAFEAKVMGTTSPCVEWVDLWSFYPQASRSIEEAEHAFLLHLMPRKKLRSLSRSPGFDPEQIERLVKLEPEHAGLSANALLSGIRTTRSQAPEVLDKRYAVWEYTGPVPKNAVEAFLSGLYAAERITAEDMAALAKILEDHALDDIECNVWMSQGIVLKIALPFMDSEESLPFYVFNYEKNPDSLFGNGVAYLCRDDQVAANQVWHAIVLNAMMSAAPQIGVKKDALVPMSGQAGGRAFHLGVSKPRVWAMTDAVDDIRQALSVFNVTNVSGALMPVYERVKANADEHTMTPLALQGEATQAVPTSSGLAMLMNSANVVMRRLAKNWDDDITVRVIRAMYAFNMDPELNPDESIKGDFRIVPKGASHLLIKDIQSQHIQYATQMFTTNPLLQPYMKPYRWAQKNLEFLDINAEDMLYTEDEVAQQQQAQGQQPDPDSVRAQAQQAQADAANKRAENDAKRIETQAALDQQNRQLDYQEHAEQIDLRRQLAGMKREQDIARLALDYANLGQDGQIAMKKLMAQLDAAEKVAETQRYKADMKAQIDAERIMREADQRIGGEP